MNIHLPEKMYDLTVLCPKCYAAMKLRHSRFGPFFGCSRYPPCTGKRTPENATALADFQDALEQVLLPPLNSEDILFNPDAPSHVWYEIHGLRLNERTATLVTQKEADLKVLEDSEKIVEELKEVAT